MLKKKKLNFNFPRKGFSELRKRLLFVIGSITVFRIGSFIPIPGIDTELLKRVFEQQKGSVIEMFNMFSGGALSRASIFALGIMPYISASIIVQLLTVLNPTLSEMKKEGEIGRRKINQYTLYGTLVLAIFQSLGVAIGLPNMPGMKELIIQTNFLFYLTSITSLVCGTMFLMWLGRQITERGIGNGISIIIFSGIVASLPSAVINTIEKARLGDLNILQLLIVSLLIFLITYFVVFIERGQRKITVNYIKRQQGRQIYTAQQSTHLPMKINMAGVIPAIFASSVIIVPTIILSFFGDGMDIKWLLTFSLYLQPGQILYILLYTIAILFFCFFYTALVFNPRETADNLKKSGTFLPGIRPGEQTAKYIDKIITKLTLIGSIYIAFICLIPELMRNIINVPFYFGGTSLLIVVVVIIDFISQIQTLMISNQYESVIKKANLKGYNR